VNNKGYIYSSIAAMAFRFVIGFYISLLCSSTLALSQTINNFKPYHPDRYTLELPKTWERNKIITAITDILSQTIDELKEMDFCTDCKAVYTVRLTIDSINITNPQTSSPVEIGNIPHYTYTFDYTFYAALIVVDTAGIPVSSLRLIAPDEIMTFLQQFTLPPQNATYRSQYVYDNRGRVVGRRWVQEAAPFNIAQPRINASSIVTENFLLNICEKKIYEIRRTLNKLNSD
jgi:hypothetical protein